MKPLTKLSAMLGMLALTAAPALAMPNGQYCNTQMHLRNTAGTGWILFNGKVTVEPTTPTGCAAGSFQCGGQYNPEAQQLSNTGGCSWGWESLPVYQSEADAPVNGYYLGEAFPVTYFHSGVNCPANALIGNGWMSYNDNELPTPAVGVAAPSPDISIFDDNGFNIGYGTLNGAKACR